MIQLQKNDLLKLDKSELIAIYKKLSEIDHAEKFKSLENYTKTAHEGQIEFHKNTRRIRYFLGGNRSGKSTGGVIEMLWHLLGTHPFRKVRVPLKGVLIIQDFENHGKNIIEPKFKQWAPPGAIIHIEKNQNGAWKKVTFSSGSTLDILSHDQDVKVFEGSDYDIAWFDEPPPQHIFTAIWRGLTDRGGFAYITATPITGPWMYQEIKKAEGGDPLRWYIYVSIRDNATNLGEGNKELGNKRINEFLSALPEEERETREKGYFLSLFGLIMKEWSRDIHLLPQFRWPAHWPIWESIDPHPSKPWAVSWTGITGNGKKILLRSGLYAGDLQLIAEQILLERQELYIERDLKPKIVRCLIDNSASTPIMTRSVIDPQARRRSLREELEGFIGPLAGGLRIEVAPKDVKQKIELFRTLLRPKLVDDKRVPEFFVFDTKENERFVFEIENYVWDTKRGGVLQGLKDKPRKIDDDILDTVMQVILTLPKKDERISPIRTANIRTYQG